MEHQHKSLDEELSDLRRRVTEMGRLVVEQIESALRCFTEHDIRGARLVIDRDASVNRMDLELEETCLDLLALHQPVAGDLRLITAAMKISTELERLGDRAVNICEAVHDRDTRESAASHAEIAQIGALATTMVAESMTAFSKGDTSIAMHVFDSDKTFDALYGLAFPRFVTLSSESGEANAHDTKLAFLSKDLNEISEHATNIAEVVLFMVDGKKITHMDIHERRPGR